MIYFCTNGFNPDASDAALYVRASDAIAAIKYAIKTFDSLGAYVLPIRAVDCNGCGAVIGGNDENTIKTFQGGVKNATCDR